MDKDKTINELTKFLVKEALSEDNEIGNNLDVNVASNNYMLPYTELFNRIEQDWGRGDLYYEIEQAIFDKDSDRIYKILKNYEVEKEYLPLLNLNETKSNYTLGKDWPDGKYKGNINGYNVYSDEVDSGFKTTTGLRNAFPIECNIYVQDGGAVVVYKDGVLFSNKEIEDKYKQALNEDFNPQDVIKVDVPLFIRLLEYAREDAKTDMDLHDVAENITKLSEEGKVLGMSEYEQIVPKQSEETKNPNPTNNHEKSLQYIDKVLDYCVKDLNLTSKPELVIDPPGYAEENHSFGGYVPGKNKIYLVVKGRNLRDVVMSECHEARHAWQNQNNMIKPGDGKDGDEIENDAQAYAGKSVRKLAREYPEILTIFNV